MGGWRSLCLIWRTALEEPQQETHNRLLDLLRSWTLFPSIRLADHPRAGIIRQDCGVLEGPTVDMASVHHWDTGIDISDGLAVVRSTGNQIVISPTVLTEFCQHAGASHLLRGAAAPPPR